MTDDDDDIEFPPPIIRTRRIVYYEQYEAAQAEIAALRAALDQERADNTRLRAFAQHKNNCAPISRREGNCHCGLSALLSGRGEAK